ncbi:MAG: preprotein translocase subunit YajC [Flavobacteriales bacterium]|nr:preprotein translocase subunit YajC [Flavobacteriales bacterium]MCB9181449.1 preprotein translocase subunit YajC [Flavobacteriales bacterium]MCB9200207.1 preprotein translocase subunit YajC [Flavobacteriales bacterium]HOP43351.1 preprotein translocase subunit YajC [Flavobacteriales bacterium]HPF67259.1 preprotein translocase subunit YajC [Flavobacteriales bacterium]
MFALTFPLQAQQQNPASFWIMMGLLMVVFYFFMIRPQQKKAKDARKFRESLQKGSKVITIGGIHGKVVELAEKTVLLEVDSGTKLRIERSAISMDSSTQLTEETAKAAK